MPKRGTQLKDQIKDFEKTQLEAKLAELREEYGKRKFRFEINSAGHKMYNQNQQNTSLIPELRAAKKNIARVLTALRKEEIQQLDKEYEGKTYKPIILRNLPKEVTENGKTRLVSVKKTKAERLALTADQIHRRSVRRFHKQKHGAQVKHVVK